MLDVFESDINTESACVPIYFTVFGDDFIVPTANEARQGNNFPMIQNITHMYIFVSANIPDQLAGNYDRNSVFIMRINGLYLKLHLSIHVIVFEYL